MQKKIKKYFVLLLKGAGMGAANVIPGVSGGTIALITGIFERLIDSIKSFNGKAIKLLFSGKLKAFIKHTDLYFLFAVLFGAVLSVASLAKALEYLFEFYPTQVWAFFFGLIMASVFFVGKTINKWKTSVIVTFIIGTAMAVSISLLTPASQNDAFYYLFICGIVAICSMILPGLSGSFVLILMGNYELVVIHAVTTLDLTLLLPVLLGAIFGLLAFSHLLSWIYKKFKDQTISLLTGFIFGSLLLLWPWKEEVYRKNAMGDLILKDGEKIVEGYEYIFPQQFNTEVMVAFVLILAGVISIVLIERFAEKKVD
jgi:putative membrane protein